MTKSIWFAFAEFIFLFIPLCLGMFYIHIRGHENRHARVFEQYGISSHFEWCDWLKDSCTAKTVPDEKNYSIAQLNAAYYDNLLVEREYEWVGLYVLGAMITAMLFQLFVTRNLTGGWEI